VVEAARPVLEYVVPLTVASWLPSWKTRYVTPAVVLAVQAKLIWLDEIGEAVSPVGGAGAEVPAEVLSLMIVEAGEVPNASTAATEK
jgi:hypothetical protein